MLDPRWRGTNLLQWLGARTYVTERLRRPFRDYYWFYDAISVTSYLLLSKNFSEYWPHPEAPVPAREQEILTQAATRYYGEHWDSARGVTRKRGRIRKPAATARANPDDPAVRYYRERNPNDADGEGLLCLCPLTGKNWVTLATRALQRVARRRSAPPGLV